MGQSVMTYLFQPKKSQEEHNDETNNLRSSKADQSSVHGGTASKDHLTNASHQEHQRNKVGLIDRYSHKSSQNNSDAASADGTIPNPIGLPGAGHTHPAFGHTSNTTTADSDDEDSAEMRNRAKNNFTFVSVVMGSTTFVLDYKRDDHKKHSAISMPDCADFRFDVTAISYENKVWSAEDLVNHLKVDIMKHLWHQRSDIIKQVFHKTSIFRSKKGLRQIAGIEPEQGTGGSRKEHKKSGLRYRESTLEPLDIDEELSPQITHELDPQMPEHGSRSVSPTMTPQSQASQHQRGPSNTSEPSVYEASVHGWDAGGNAAGAGSFDSSQRSVKGDGSSISTKENKRHRIGSLVKKTIHKATHPHHHHDKDRESTATASSSRPAHEESKCEASAMLDEAGGGDIVVFDDDDDGGSERERRISAMQ